MTYLLELENCRAPLDWREVFDRDSPVSLEIGFGKGRTLLGAAQQHPHQAFIGLELSQFCLRLVGRRIERRGLDNVKVVHADAGQFLRHYVPPASLESVCAYCPDPWHKTRHNKRRLFTFAFIRTIAQSLRPGGTFLFTSDYTSYFHDVLTHVNDAVEFTAPIVTLRHPHDATVQARTNYENKWLQQGRSIWTLETQRNAQQDLVPLQTPSAAVAAGTGKD